MGLIDVEEQTLRLLSEKSEYKEILERIVSFEEGTPKPESNLLDGTDYDTWWKYDDVYVQPARLGYLVSQGIVEKIFDSNNTTAYVLRDRSAVKEALEVEESRNKTMEELREDLDERLGELRD